MKKLALFIEGLLMVGLIVLANSCEKEVTEQKSSNIDTLEAVSVNTTLDAAKIYLAINAVQVNATLTIPAGTIIKFTQNGRIDVSANGSIQAIGTEEKPIIFTSIKDDARGGDTNGDNTSTTPAAKDWGAVTSYGNGSTFTYCQFYYGGNWGDHTNTLEIKWCTATVTHCTFAYNYGGLLSDNTNGALCIKEADYASTVNNNIFYGNDIPMSIDVNMSLDATNIFHKPTDITIKNKYNGVFVDSYTNNSAVVWEENEVPFVMITNMGIESTASLTLNSDVVLKMYPNTRIDIASGGTLNHNGAIITSFKDDTHLGDTNGDTNITSPAVGDWVGINLGYGNYMTGTNILYATH